MVLIGRRHWLGGRDGTSLLWHFVLRACFLFVIVVSGVLIVQHSALNRARIDISDEKVSTLSPSTLKLLNKLGGENEDGQADPINVTAYIGNDIPSEFVRTKYDLVNLLREFDALGGSRINVDLQQGIEPFSKQAVLASKRYGIRPQEFSTQSRGIKRDAEVILGLAVASGVERVVVPFLPYGTPVEYELMRSINTVSQNQRKTIGIVLTDAVIQGAVVPGPQGKTVRLPVLKIVRELAKQYDIEQVNASSEIDLWVSGEEGEPDQRRYSMLLVAQPSKMSEAEMSNLILAIESGQPTAIFEDPFPNSFSFKRHVPGTFGPRVLNRGGQPADIQKLWKALDIDTDRLSAGNGKYVPWIVWQPESFNPYPKDKRLSLPELVIVKDVDPLNPAINRDHPATSRIDELFFQYAGYVSPTKTTELEFTPLVKVNGAGRLRGDLAMPQVPPAARDSQRGLADGQFVLACHIKGAKCDESDSSAAPSKDRTNVIYVADLDVLSDYFVDIRNEPIRDGIEFFFQDMSFVLNIVDALAGEDTFLGLRNRRFRHVTLGKIETQKEKELQKVFELNNQYEIDFKIEVEKVRADARKKLRPLENEIKDLEDRRDARKPYDAAALAAKQGILKQQQQEQEQKLRVSVQELNNSLNEKKRQADLDAELAIQEIQRTYKLAAVVLPVIPPFLLGLFVFTRRRLREREGISKERRLT